MPYALQRQTSLDPAYTHIKAKILLSRYKRTLSVIVSDILWATALTVLLKDNESQKHKPEVSKHPLSIGESFTYPCAEELPLSNTMLNTHTCDRAVPTHSLQFAYFKYV